MTTTTSEKAVVVALLAAIVLVVFGVCRHDRAVAGDAEIRWRDSVIAQDSVTIDSLKHITQSHETGTKTATVAVTHAAASWTKHSDTVTVTVEKIVHDTTADSTKIKQLAQLVLDGKRKADSLARAAEAASDSVAVLLVSFDIERAGWENQRSTMQTQIIAVKKQIRRWGITASVGYDPLDLNLHKPRLNLGLGFIY